MGWRLPLVVVGLSLLAVSDASAQRLADPPTRREAIATSH